MTHSVQIQINNTPLTIETGKVAKQSDGAVVVRCGGTMVLSTVVASKSALEGRDFLPLTVEYREKAYAGGRIPGGFFKREGRPDEKETLTCRLIDRPLRPLFPKGFRNEIQIINLVISADSENDPDILAMIGSSAAVALSGIPFSGPVGAVRVALVDGKLVANPTYKQVADSPLELVIAGTEDAILMVESGGREISEEQMLEALAFGHEQCRAITRMQKDLMARAAKPRWALHVRAPGGGAVPVVAGAGVGLRQGVAGALGAREASPGAGPRGHLRRGLRRGRRRGRDPEAQGPGLLREGRADRGARAQRREGHPGGRPQRQGGPTHLGRGGVPAARSRVGAVHARGDPGAGHRDPRHKG